MTLPHHRFPRALALLAGLSALLFSLPAGAQRPSASERSLVLVPSAPNAASGLDVSRISLEEDALDARVVGLEDVDEAWQILVYIDTALTREAVVQRLANSLLEQLDQLLALGTVEIVLADPTPHSILPPTQDRELLTQALERLSIYDASEDALRARRAAFLQRRREYQAALARGDTGDRPDTTTLARAAVRDEVAMQLLQQDALLDWLAGMTPAVSSEPRALFLLNEALGHDPSDFYGESLERGESAQLATAVTDLPTTRELANDLSALGWTVMPVAYGAGEIEKSGPFQYNPTQNLPVGFRIRLGRGDRDKDESPAEEFDLKLDEPRMDQLAQIASGAGGSVVGSAESFERSLASLGRARRVRYYSHPDLPLRAQYPLELTISGGDRDALLARSSTSHGLLPDSVASARIRRALVGESEGETLGIEALLEFDSGRIGQAPATVTVEAPIFSGGVEPGPVRVSLGIAIESETETEVIVRHALIEAPRKPSEGAIWRFEDELVLPAGTSTAVALVETSFGDWGIAFAELSDRRFKEPAGEDSTSLAQAAGNNAIRLAPEDPAVTRGRAIFVTETRDDVERVEFQLNGERVAVRNRAPFQARINLGPSGGFSEITAIAFDADGFELDRDSLLINEPPESFWIRIVEPRPGRRVGRVEVETTVKVPEGGTLATVDLYWGDRRFATLDAPPWRAPVYIPVDNPDGFVRAVATLSNGRTTEDVVLMNRPGFGTQIGVELVELYVVATDRKAQPVRGLKRDDFTVLEDEVVQEIETFSAAGDLPLTVGLAIDSSSSLFLKMPSVQRAARDFTRSLIADRDRAFLVEFGSRPKMVQPTTQNLRSILDGISSLEPFGTTPVWEAIVMSLRELESVQGRKALVVFYDGDDEDEDFSFNECLRLARKVNVPIYLIVMNDSAARSEGRSFSTRSFVARLERLARAGGGRVYFVSTEQELGDIFQAISEELRSHYLLTYYPKSAAGGPQWRPVEVRIEGRGLEARTIEGYGEPRP